MKNIFTFLFISINILFLSGTSLAQCTPDPDCTDPDGDGEYCPSEFPNAVEDEYYDQTLTIIAPTEQGGFVLHHVDVLDIGNIPPGMNYQCQDDDCSFYPATPKCINVFGTPAIGSWGEYNLELSIEIFIDVVGNPVSIGTFTDSSAVVFIEPQLYGNFVINDGVTDFLCQGSEYTITYTGNASENAIYNWDFGDNASVLSGEGQGPYVVMYDTYLGADSISLYVEEDIYTSPVFVEDYSVDICEGIAESDINKVRVHPNPFNDFISVSGLEKNAIVRVFDLTAKEISSSVVSVDQNQIDLSYLKDGIYLISIQSDNYIKTQKIVKR